MFWLLVVRMKIITLLLVVLISGCAFHRTMDVDITGKNIRSPYGNGDADIHYKANTTFYFLQ